MRGDMRSVGSLPNWRAVRGSRLNATLAAAGCLVVCAYLAGQASEATSLREANELGLRGSYLRAIGRAAPLVGTSTSLGGLLVEAHAYFALGKFGHASSLFARASQLAPRDWQIHMYWAEALQNARQRGRAAQQLSIAKTLNPGVVPPAGFVLRTPFILDGARWAVFENPMLPWARSALAQPLQPGHRWKLVSILVRNLSRSGFDPRVLAYRLRDATGRTYQADRRSGTGSGLSAPAHAIGARARLVVRLAFDVPASSSGLSLTFPTSPNGAPAAKVPLTG